MGSVDQVSLLAPSKVLGSQKPEPAKIRAVSHEAAIDQSFKRMSSPSLDFHGRRSGSVEIQTSSALNRQAVSSPRRPATQRKASPSTATRPTEGNGRCVATSSSPVAASLPQKTDPDAGRLLGVVLEAVVPVGMVEADREYGVAERRSAGRRRTSRGPRCARGYGRRCGGRPRPAPPHAPLRRSAAGCGTRSRTAWRSTEAHPAPASAWRYGRSRATSRT